ncbi:uncharacterized protein LOC115623129 [Scaptodrosophila lebanonensis]|uniref:Uncharacterized protein LOC115623129 n=1 Tax=Drosophila lebanonensis TaxID=7225 RepID=A0A6J2TDK0_DROLE|nr:uncharacterized protein LOC115623129 [Scaptodrosophila lebanonensis]
MSTTFCVLCLMLLCGVRLEPTSKTSVADPIHIEAGNKNTEIKEATEFFQNLQRALSVLKTDINKNTHTGEALDSDSRGPSKIMVECRENQQKLIHNNSKTIECAKKFKPYIFPILVAGMFITGWIVASRRGKTYSKPEPLVSDMVYTVYNNVYKDKNIAQCDPDGYKSFKKYKKINTSKNIVC